MISSHQFFLFCLTSIVLIFTPGPDIIYVLTRGVAQGRNAALAAAAGFSLGNIGHTLLAICGISAILAASSLAFMLVKIAGGAYLIFIGVKVWQAETTLALGAAGEHKGSWLIFRQSIVANLLNPKVAIFFLAFFPQFIHPAQGNPALQMFILGLTFVALTMLCFSVVALTAGMLNTRLLACPSMSVWLHKGAGTILILLGLRLFWV